MINNKRLLALIPARSGSKRLPHKNSLNLGGKPLIAWSIDAGLQSKYVDRVVVSTDSNAIAAMAKQYGADIPFIRPEVLASDTATTIDVVRHAISMLEKENDFYDYILLLQPTSPLRNTKHIDEAVELLISKPAHGIIGVTEVEHPVEWINTLPMDNSMEDFLKTEYRDIRSQDFPVRYRINGAIYLSKIENVLSEGSLFLSKKCYAYIMPRSVSLDIDSNLDFKVAESILNMSE